MSAMHSRFASTLASVLVATFVAPTFVLAQTAPAPASPDESKKEEAVVHFTKGVSLMQDEQWDAALAEFLIAFSLYPLKNARRNAARCLKQLGRFDEALVTWRSVRTEFADKLKPEEQEEAKREILDLEGKVGSLTIVANVDGATVVVDGRERGKTPLAQPLIVPAGTRVVRVTKEGFVPFEAKPSVAGRTSITVDAKLQPLARAGRLRVVEEEGRTLEVVVDGVVTGKTPSWEGVVAPGAHIVLLRSTDGASKLGTPPTAVTVVADDTAVIRLRAEELAGSVHLTVDPIGAKLVLDGVPLGQGEWEGALRAGTHKVDASADGYFATTKTFDVPAGPKVAMKLTLERDDSSPFWSKGRSYPLSVTLFGGGLAGPSLGGSYEASCGKGAECHHRGRPLGFLAGVRAGYEIAPRLAIELTAGFAWVRMSVARITTLQGDNEPVPVDIEDTVTISGPFVTGGASYAFLKRPFGFAVALGAGAMLARTKEVRTGTVSTDVDPKSRELRMDPIATISKITPFLLPELRLSYAVGTRIDVGASLGAMIVVSDVRPVVRGQAVPVLAESPSPPRYNKQVIGFLPRGAAESATGTFVLPQLALFVRASF